MVYKGLQISFVSLAWPWPGRSLPQGEPVGVLGPWTWAQCGWVPSSPATNYLTNQKYDRLTFFHMAGWPANCSWLGGYLTKCQPDHAPGRDILWPRVLPLWSGWPVVRCTPKAEKSGGQVWHYFRSGWHLVTFQSGWPLVNVPLMDRQIFWPNKILLQVRLTCLLEGKSGASSHHNSSSISIY